jgi:ubiquitin carboxyl-terminal hydrolase 36/42
MDLTLEIFGWVESLEDALTQFTTPEELDGENMYRCGRLDNLFPFPFLSFFISVLGLEVKIKLLNGSENILMKRCAAYVRARKQLSIHEAPNILTIVLKRFQVCLHISVQLLSCHMFNLLAGII